MSENKKKESILTVLIIVFILIELYVIFLTGRDQKVYEYRYCEPTTKISVGVNFSGLTGEYVINDKIKNILEERSFISIIVGKSGEENMSLAILGIAKDGTTYYASEKIVESVFQKITKIQSDGNLIRAIVDKDWGFSVIMSLVVMFLGLLIYVLFFI